MADGFEPYHVPQQSRRDKLRVTQDQNNHHLHSCNTNTPLFPTLYDPSLLSSDLINLHRQSFNLGVKEEGLMMNFMGNNFMGGVNNMINTSGPLSSSLPTNQNHHMYADPQLQVNPSSIHHQQNQNNFNTHPYYRAVLLDQNPTNQSLSLELNLQRHDDSSSVYSNKVSELGGLSTAGYVVGTQYGNNNNGSVEISRSSVPLGPFTGYASVLNGSRFLKPAQLLLDELCDAGRGVYVERNGPDPGLMDPSPFEGHHGVDESVSCSVDMSEQSRKKSGLLSMLDEVYKRYKMYYQQIQAVIASFESVAGLSNAAPFANLALKALTKHFRSLKNTITDQLQFASKSHGNIMNYNNDRDENQILDNSPSGKGPYGQRSFQHASFVEQPVWRPQRGLPERAVTVLRAWLFEHFLHPYPTDNDKLMLAKQTGLSRNQVSNWFINARVRLWKPMVEEIHTLETRQTQKHSQREEPPEPSRLNDHLPINCSLDQSENPSTSVQRIGDQFPMKRGREDLTETSRGGREMPLNFTYENLSHERHLGMGVSNVGGGNGGGGVSLTLGLHQNGMGLSEAYPMTAARRFGLDLHEEAYGLSGFTTQNRQFGRDIIG